MENVKLKHTLDLVQDESDHRTQPVQRASVNADAVDFPMAIQALDNKRAAELLTFRHKQQSVTISFPSGMARANLILRGQVFIIDIYCSPTLRKPDELIRNFFSQERDEKKYGSHTLRGYEGNHLQKFNCIKKVFIDVAACVDSILGIASFQVYALWYRNIGFQMCDHFREKNLPDRPLSTKY